MLKFNNKCITIVLLLVIVSISSILIFLVMQDGHNWGGDFALYILQTKAILHGTLESLYIANKYSMDNSSILYGPYLYPNGLPVLLIPIYYLFGLNFLALKIYISLFFIASIPLIFHYFKKLFFSIYSAFFITAFVAFHFNYVIYASDNITSDIPYFFLVFLVFSLMLKKINIRVQVFIGIIIFYAYFTRDVGISLLLTLVVYQFIHIKDQIDIKIKLIPYFIFFILFFINFFVSYSGGSNHYELFFNISFSSIKQNIIFYANLISKFIILKNFPFFYNILASFALIPIFIGVLVYFKKYLYLIIYISSNLFILLLWPVTQGNRFVFSIIPFLIFFFLKGSFYIFAKLKLQRVLSGILILYLIIFIRTNINYIRNYAVYKERNSIRTEELIEVYSYLSENIHKRETVAFFKPRVLKLFANIQTVGLGLGGNDFGESTADYLLAEKRKLDTTFVEIYKIEKEFKNYIILKK